jgi:hypothetical protein
MARRTIAVAVVALSALYASLQPSAAQASVYEYPQSPATDVDTECATIFTLLAEEAYNNGMASNGFEAQAALAQQYHLATYPGDNAQRYALFVVDGVQSVKAAMSRGILTVNDIVDAARSCNRRYSGL